MKEISTNKSLFTTNDKVSEFYNSHGRYDRMTKSLSAGYGISPATQQDGGALRPQALDTDIKQVTWGSADLTIYNDIARQQIDNTVAKYVVYYDHGRVGHERFQPEIGLGNQTQPSIKQKTVEMRYLAAPSQTSMVLQKADTIEDPVALQEMASINVLAKTIEWAIFYGDSSLTAQDGSGLQFDGIDKLMDEGNKLDVRGDNLDPVLLNKAATKIGTAGYGVATDAYMPIGVKADFINKYLGAQRILVPSADGLQAGLNIDSFLSARGTIKLNGSTIMDTDGMLNEDRRPEPGAPLAPSVETEVVTDADGQFLDADVVDGHEENQVVAVPKEVGKDLQYRVVAVGSKGDSAPSDVVTAKPANATDGVKLTITLDALGREVPDYLAVYRKSLIAGNNDTYFLIGQVPMSQMDAGNGSVEFTDTDEVIAGTTNVFVMEQTPQVLNLYEFLPMTKLPLAIQTNATQFAIMWWGALRLSFPKRVVKLANVRYATDAADYSFGSRA